MTILLSSPRLARLLAVACCLIPCPAIARQQTADTLPVTEVVAAVRGGSPTIAEIVERAARACRRADEGSWERRVLTGIMASPLASYLGPNTDPFTMTNVGNVAGAMTRAFLCDGMGVQEWIRAGLYADLAVDAYIPLLEGLERGTPFSLLRDLVRDPDADPMHRLWATELQAGDPMMDLLREPRPGTGMNDALANGPEAYRAKWLPVLLASAYSREAVVQSLAQYISVAPGASGVPSILRIMAADVEAYDFRFSEETRAMVRSLLEDLARRDDVSQPVRDAIRDVEAARSEHRNHLGVVVRRAELDLTASEAGGACVLSGPQLVLEAIERVVPGYRVDDARSCGSRAVRKGDFDGDGAQDALIAVTTGQRRSFLVVLAGGTPRAYPIEPGATNPYGEVRPPGTFRATCGSPETLTFPNDHIATGAGLFWFADGELQTLPSTGPCA